MEDGWGPTTPDDDTLLRRCVLATADAHATFAEVCGRATRLDGLTVTDTGCYGSYFNGAVATAPIRDAEAADGAIREHCTRRPAYLFSAFHTPDLAPLGWKLEGHPPFMVRPAGGTVPPDPPGLTVERVHDARTAADLERVVREGYPVPDIEPGTVLGERLGLLRWVGYAGGEPVAIAVGSLGRGMNDVELVATMPEARGRGYGAAVTWRATLMDPSLPSVLIASDLGRPVYARMGYVPLLRLTLWSLP